MSSCLLVRGRMGGIGIGIDNGGGVSTRFGRRRGAQDSSNRLVPLPPPPPPRRRRSESLLPVWHWVN